MNGYIRWSALFWCVLWLVRLVACFCCQEIEDAKPDSDPTKVEVKAAKFIPQFAASKWCPAGSTKGREVQGINKAPKAHTMALQIWCLEDSFAIYIFSIPFGALKFLSAWFCPAVVFLCCSNIKNLPISGCFPYPLCGVITRIVTKF